MPVAPEAGSPAPTASFPAPAFSVQVARAEQEDPDGGVAPDAQHETADVGRLDHGLGRRVDRDHQPRDPERLAVRPPTGDDPRDARRRVVEGQQEGARVSRVGVDALPSAPRGMRARPSPRSERADRAPPPSLPAHPRARLPRPPPTAAPPAPTRSLASRTGCTRTAEDWRADRSPRAPLRRARARARSPEAALSSSRAR